jgi:N-acetylmuramoyl-L-alanine amidase
LKTSNGHSKPAAKKKGAKRVVMLDPGHGGIDTGAIGHNGSKEKHVVLAIAKNVRSILRSNGIDARLTRSGDTFIPLYDRVEIAHQHGADHVNSRRWFHQPKRGRRLRFRPFQPRRQ